jgi:hypothetical protein
MIGLQEQLNQYQVLAMVQLLRIRQLVDLRDLVIRDLIP